MSSSAGARGALGQAAEAAADHRMGMLQTAGGAEGTSGAEAGMAPGALRLAGVAAGLQAEGRATLPSAPMCPASSSTHPRLGPESNMASSASGSVKMLGC